MREGLGLKITQMKDMMHLKKLFLMIASFIILLIPITSFALFCPTNFNQIEIGNSIDKVKELCGKPDKEDTKKVEENVPQEWNYFVAQSVDMGMGTNQPAQGTLKTSFMFDKDGKLINISVNGIGVGATNICGTNVQLGDKQDSVKNACGDPTFVNKQTSTATGTPTKTQEIIEFIYNTTPPIKLIFIDGKLTERQQ